jgi:hypothetical protein
VYVVDFGVPWSLRGVSLRRHRNLRHLASDMTGWSAASPRPLRPKCSGDELSQARRPPFRHPTLCLTAALERFFGAKRQIKPGVQKPAHLQTHALQQTTPSFSSRCEIVGVPNGWHSRSGRRSGGSNAWASRTASARACRAWLPTSVELPPQSKAQSRPR